MIVDDSVSGTASQYVQTVLLQFLVINYFCFRPRIQGELMFSEVSVHLSTGEKGVGGGGYLPSRSYPGIVGGYSSQVTLLLLPLPPPPPPMGRSGLA